MLLEPFFIHLDFKTGDDFPHNRTNIRKLSDMKGMFHNTKEESQILEKDDPVIYSFSEKVLPEENGHLQLATTSIRPGVVAYIPPYRGHRMVNTERTPFVFFAVYPGDAGHNYGDTERTGFVKILVGRDGKPIPIHNPRWEKA